jgi:VWFA-related protein
MRWTKFSRKIARPVSLGFSLTGFLVILCSVSALPQETTLRSQANVVLIPALVQEAKGEIVYGLTAKDFAVEDDGVEMPVRLDDVPEGQPVSLVVAIQCGRRASYEFPRMQGLHTMLEPLFAQGTTRAAIVEFDSAAKIVRDFTRDDALITADMQNLQPGDGGAAIVDAVSTAVNLLKDEPQENLRVLLLISENHDHGSQSKVEAAVAAIGQANVLMYALAFSPGVSNILDTARGNNKNEMHEGVNFLDLFYRTAQAMRKNVPATVAAMTGGEYELFTTRKKFEVRMNDFTNHLHGRYSLSISPSNPRAGLHQLRVRLRNGGNRSVLARTSYWAEAPKP